MQQVLAAFATCTGSPVPLKRRCGLCLKREGANREDSSQTDDDGARSEGSDQSICSHGGLLHDVYDARLQQAAAEKCRSGREGHR